MIIFARNFYTMKLSKEERNNKRNADIVEQFSNNPDNRIKLAHALANRYDISIQRVYQILNEQKNKQK